MSHRFFITMTSQDRPGVLAAVTTAFAELGGDMEYATHTVVHGLSTMSVVADFPSHRTWEVIRDHLLQVGRAYEMDVLIREMPSEENIDVQSTNRYFLSVTGCDAPGVVRALCVRLSQELASIKRLFAVPDSSETFSMVMQINFPEGVQIKELTKELESFGALNKLTISLQDEKSYNIADFPREIATDLLPKTKP